MGVGAMNRDCSPRNGTAVAGAAGGASLHSGLTAQPERNRVAPTGLEELQAALGDSYLLERELGRGGMATVYLAQDLKHDRPVALKLLHEIGRAHV